MQQVCYGHLLQTVTSQAGGPDFKSIIQYPRWEITLDTGGYSGAGGKTSIVSTDQQKSWWGFFWFFVFFFHSGTFLLSAHAFVLFYRCWQSCLPHGNQLSWPHQGVAPSSCESGQWIRDQRSECGTGECAGTQAPCSCWYVTHLQGGPLQNVLCTGRLVLQLTLLGLGGDSRAAQGDVSTVTGF